MNPVGPDQVVHNFPKGDRPGIGLAPGEDERAEEIEEVVVAIPEDHVEVHGRVRLPAGESAVLFAQKRSRFLENSFLARLKVGDFWG